MKALQNGVIFSLALALSGCADNITSTGVGFSKSKDQSALLTGARFNGSNKCIFTQEPEIDDKGIVQLGDDFSIAGIVDGLATNAVNIAIDEIFDAVKSVIDEAAEDDEAIYSLRKNLRGASKNDLPYCWHVVVGDFHTTESSFSSDSFKKIMSNMPGDFTPNELDKLYTVFKAEQLFLAHAPRLMFELVLLRGDVATAKEAYNSDSSFGAILSPVFYSYRAPIGTNAIGTGSSARDLNLTMSVGAPGAQAPTGEGHLLELPVFEKVPPGTFARIDLGMIESPWQNVEFSDASTLRVVQLDLVESRNGSRIAKSLQKLWTRAESDGIVEEGKSQLNEFVIKLVLPEERANAVLGDTDADNACTAEDALAGKCE